MTGTAWVFRDNVNTDEIIPARYLNISEDAELAKHCMEDIDPEFVTRVKPGDILVAGMNFGCGSSREHAPRAIKAAGVAAVIARSFARIFFRNAINMGLPIVECPEAVEDVRAGHRLTVDLAASTITNETTGRTFRFEPFPPEMQAIIQAGGLMNFVTSRRPPQDPTSESTEGAESERN
jgi:3-isopropylmalate/(R)-2-methylmalate dehydratase small subunit